MGWHPLVPLDLVSWKDDLTLGVVVVLVLVVLVLVLVLVLLVGGAP